MTRRNYDPFPQSGVARWFDTGANHAIAVSRFASWLKNYAPAYHAKIAATKPELLDGAKAVQAATISPKPGTLGGLRDITIDPVTGDVWNDTTGGTAATAGGGALSVVSQWGSDILNIGRGVLAIKQQDDLVKMNVARAEKGLPPLDATATAPQLNLGLSPQTQQLVTYGAIGLGVMFLFRMLGRK